VKRLLCFGCAVTVAATLAAFAGTAGASARPRFLAGAQNVVFVQTDGLGGNQVVAYDRAGNGTLTLSNTYATGGLGGMLGGSVVDHLASQGSLAYDPTGSLLLAVNAGSNSLSVFAVRGGDQLVLTEVVGSGGIFPVSIAVHGSLVYVLNAEGAGTLQGYRVVAGFLAPIPGSQRSLDLTPVTGSSQFTNTPGQVAFSPSGSQLIVTTKANGNDIDVFGVGPFGLLSAGPVLNLENGAVPFAVSFDAEGHLVVADAGTDALSTFTLNANGTVTPIDTVATGQSATCWVAPARGFFYASNAGSGTVSGYSESSAGELALLGSTGTDPGTVDASAAAGGQFLYVQTGRNGIVDEFQVAGDGSLDEIGSVVVAGSSGGEGIVAF
jgi:6-phosphogluconolactonase (cycloisomerase 2 family)